MEDLNFIGMCIGIVVVGAGIIAYVIMCVLKLLFSPVGKVIEISKNKKAGYYDSPPSPDGFFADSYKRHYNELIGGNFSKVPYGCPRRFLMKEHTHCAYSKTDSFVPYAEIAAKILASEDEVKTGFRPSYFPVGYPKFINDLWKCLEIEFPKDYKFYNMFMDKKDFYDSEVEIQKQKEADYNRIHKATIKGES